MKYIVYEDKNGVPRAHRVYLSRYAAPVGMEMPLPDGCGRTRIVDAGDPFEAVYKAAQDWKCIEANMEASVP